MNLLLIGLLSISVIAVVVLLVAWMFFRASNDGYYIDEDGSPARPERDEGITDPAQHAATDLTPADPPSVEASSPLINYVPGLDIVPAFLALTADSPVFDDAPASIIARQENIPASVVNESLNATFHHKGVAYEESGSKVTLRAEEGEEVIFYGDRSNLVINSVKVELEVPEPDADTPIAETLYARPLMSELGNAIVEVLEDNPRVKVGSAATTRKVIAAHTKMFPTQGGQVKIKILSYDAQMVKHGGDDGDE